MGMVELLLVRSVVGALRNGRILLASGVGVQRAAWSWSERSNSHVRYELHHVLLVVCRHIILRARMHNMHTLVSIEVRVVVYIHASMYVLAPRVCMYAYWLATIRV